MCTFERRDLEVNRNERKNHIVMRTQKEIIKDALLRGETLDQLSMLFDYGVGNHTAVMTLVRRDLQGSGLSVVTEWKVARSRKTGRKISYAVYYIPEFRKTRWSWRSLRNRLIGR